jgi:NTP pyrophosphatase (non-canonical NTP hydrolase)
MNNINELIERAHAQAKAMGWWDTERNIGELLMLIVSECGEALEAHRSGKRANLQGALPISELPSQTGDNTQSDFQALFKLYIKDTFEDELADIVIRIADYAGFMGYELHVPKKVELIRFVKNDNVGESLFGIVRSISSVRMLGVDSDETRLSAAVIGCFSLANMMNADLWKHIDLKLKYNLTRGKKHGKAY